MTPAERITYLRAMRILWDEQTTNSRAAERNRAHTPSHPLRMQVRSRWGGCGAAGPVAVGLPAARRNAAAR
jgi:hypothetical protein